MAKIYESLFFDIEFFFVIPKCEQFNDLGIQIVICLVTRFRDKFYE